MLRLLHRYSMRDGAAALAGSADDFDGWLAASLRGTPADPGSHHPLPEAAQARKPPFPWLRKDTVELDPEDAEVSGGPGLLPYYDRAELEQALAQPMDDERPKYLKQMRARGPYRFLRRVPSDFDFSGLRENFPNFDEVSDFIERQVDLCRLSPNKAAAFQPLLLLGDPGVGKTRYLLEVSSLLGLEFNLIQCGGVSANFVLSGSTTSWKNGKPGKIHTALRDGKTINPVIMLDEIDKLNGSLDYDAHGPLYQLLEKKTAKAFQDECIELPMDCSRIIWVATANNLHAIPEAIVSRLVVLDVPAPSGEGLRRVAKSIYRDILAEFSDAWGGMFAPALPESVLAEISTNTPREIRKRLLCACGNAASRHLREGRAGESAVTLLPRDLDVLPACQHVRGPGFLSR
jgi:ATP-dependent Lon protease